MIEIEWDVRDALSFFEQISPTLRRKIYGRLKYWADKVRDQAKKNAPKWRGNLARSIYSSASIAMGRIVAKVGASIYYAELVHQGRPPNFSREFVPWSKGVEGRKLKAWAASKGINTSNRPGLWVKRDPHPFITDALKTYQPLALYSVQQAIRDAKGESRGG